MKTEQEQIEQIEKVLKYSVADYKHLKKKGMCYCYAETLIDHGYGDVSEYKAEIEQLNKKLAKQTRIARDANAKFTGVEHYLKPFQYKADRPETKCNDLKELSDWQRKEIKRLKAEVKQAQIDVLNELKKKYGFYSCYSWNCDTKSLNEIIDELIKEIEK